MSRTSEVQRLERELRDLDRPACPGSGVLIPEADRVNESFGFCPGCNKLLRLRLPSDPDYASIRTHGRERSR